MMKRFFDFFVSFIAVLILSPLLVVIVVMVYLSMGRPIFFSQERPGLNSKVFKMYKFRSMSNELNVDGNLLPDNLRLTKVGKFLRKTSLDELPALFNVLNGDMSLVGPRPLLVKYLPYYTKNEMLRHSVRPGITGLAQVNGRNTSSWEERFHFDLEYVKNQSLMLDIKILFKTLKKVIQSDGVEVIPNQVMDDLDEQRKNKNS